VIAVPTAALVAYSLILLAYCRDQDNVLMRHQLIWPSLLAVAVTLYTGLHLNEASELPTALLPIGALGVYILVGLFLEQKAFVALSLGVMAVSLFVLSRLWLTEAPTALVRYSASFLFSTAVASYVAIFEAWRITSHLALKTRDSVGTIIDATPKVRLYYVSTLVALSGSFWLMPVAAIFTDLGPWFVIGFALHAASALGLWLVLGHQMFWLSRDIWPRARFAMGELFVLFIAVERFLPNNSPSMAFLKMDDFGRGVAISFAVGGVGLFLVRLATGYRTRPQIAGASPLAAMFASRLNILRAFALLSSVMTFVLAWLRPETLASPLSPKIDVAILVYLLVVFCVFVLDVIGNQLKAEGLVAWLVGVCTLTRVPTSIAIGAVVGFGLALGGASGSTAWLLSLPFTLIAMGGFALNDIHDREKDSVNRPSRALPAGILTLRQAKGFAAVLLFAALVSSLMLARNAGEAALYLLALAGVVVYSDLAKRLGWAKGAFSSMLSVLPLAFVAQSELITGLDVIVLGGAFVYVFGRELLLDVRDIEGDRRAGFRTIAVRYGESTGALAGIGLQALGALLILISAVVLGSNSQVLLAVATAVAVALTAGWWYSVQRHRRGAALFMWLPMLSGAALLSI